MKWVLLFEYMNQFNINKMEYCEYCKEVRTSETNRKGKRECASCHNNNYSNDLMRGEAVKIRFYKEDYKQGTYEQIIALLAINKKTSKRR